MTNMIWDLRDKLTGYIVYNEFASNLALSLMTFTLLSALIAIALGTTEINLAFPFFFSGFVFVALSSFDLIKRYG